MHYTVFLFVRVLNVQPETCIFKLKTSTRKVFLLTMRHFCVLRLDFLGVLRIWQHQQM